MFPSLEVIFKALIEQDPKELNQTLKLNLSLKLLLCWAGRGAEPDDLQSFHPTKVIL